MATAGKRNALLPWFIGVVIVLICDAMVATWMFGGGCQAPGIAQILVLVVIPVVYLVLAYLTLRSQN